MRRHWWYSLRPKVPPSTLNDGPLTGAIPTVLRAQTQFSQPGKESCPENEPKEKVSKEAKKKESEKEAKKIKKQKKEGKRKQREGKGEGKEPKAKKSEDENQKREKCDEKNNNASDIGGQEGETSASADCDKKLNRKKRGREDQASNDQMSAVGCADNNKSMKRIKVVFGPSERYAPFLDTVLQRAPPAACAAVDGRIERASIFRHPYRSDSLLAPPACRRCARRGAFCDRRPGACSNCKQSKQRCVKEGPWECVGSAGSQSGISSAAGSFPRAVSPSSSPKDGEPIMPGTSIGENAVQTNPTELLQRGSNDYAVRGWFSNASRTNGPPEQDLRQQDVPQLWSSDHQEMQETDPFFPDGKKNVKMNNSGVVVSLVIDSTFLPEGSRIEAGDVELWLGQLGAAALQGLSLALEVQTSIHLYRDFGSDSRRSLTSHGRTSDLRIAFTGIFGIEKIETSEVEPKGLTRISLKLKPARDASALSSSIPEPVSSITGATSKGHRSRSLSLTAEPKNQHSFSGFRCQQCSRANTRRLWMMDVCRHCHCLRRHGAIPDVSVQSKKKMQLEFTGPRSDLGQASFILSPGFLTDRTISTFDDGVRVASYRFLLSIGATGSKEDMERAKSDRFSTLQHHLMPNCFISARQEFQELTSLTLPYGRLCQEKEERLLGSAKDIADCFGPEVFCLEQTPQELTRPLQKMSHAFVRSAMIAEKPCRRGVSRFAVFLLTENGTLKILPTFFSHSSTKIGILSFGGPTRLSLSKKKTCDNLEDQIDDKSMGCLQLQHGDCMILDRQLLSQVGVKLTGTGVTVWLLADFAHSGD